jgi:hypothetical protein
MNSERSWNSGVVAPDLIRDYLGWWSYLAVMGSFGPDVDLFAPDGRLDTRVSAGSE